MKAMYLCAAASLAVATILYGCGHNHSHAEGEEKEDHHDHENEIVVSEAQQKSMGITVETVEERPFAFVLKASGQIVSPQGDEQTLVATGSGIITFKDNAISEGTAVKQGACLATVSARSLQDGDPDDKARIELKTAESELERAERLAEDRIVSARELEAARDRYEKAKTALSGTKTGEKSNRSICSPVTGYVKRLLVTQGQYVETGQPIAEVTRNGRLQLRVDVSERHVSDLPYIKSANFKTGSSTETVQADRLHGKIISYGRTAEQGYIPMIIELDNVGNVLPGNFAEVWLLGKEDLKTITIPLQSLIEEQGVYSVFVKTEKDAFEKRVVDRGHDDGLRVQITRGIEVGDVVVVNGARLLRLKSMNTAIPHGHSH